MTNSAFRRPMRTALVFQTTAAESQPEIDDGGGGGCQCPSQTSWGGEDVVLAFGFKPISNGGTVQFFPADGAVGEWTTAPIDGLWVVQNDENSIFFNFTRNQIPGVTSLTITIAACEHPENPITLYAFPSGGGVAGQGNGSWQLEAGKTYCVTVTPSYFDPS